MEDLESQSINTPKFSLDGVITRAKIVKVYDGDSVHAVFELLGKYYRWVCRLAHIDTPEIKTKNEEEKAHGLEVKQILTDMLLDKIFLIDCYQFDKYGRLLIELTLPSGEKLHNWMIRNKHAHVYEGGTKLKW